MRARVDFVARHWNGVLVDVGIGSGAFIEARDAKGHQTIGFDVCPQAIEWLLARNKIADPYRFEHNALCFWDVLEHIPNFPTLLANVTQWVFVSIPIFTDCDHVLRSKHLRCDEHVWYFTSRGLNSVMRWLGFECVEYNDMESQIGREDIGTFAFRRI